MRGQYEQCPFRRSQDFTVRVSRMFRILGRESRSRRSPFKPGIPEAVSSHASGRRFARHWAYAPRCTGIKQSLAASSLAVPPRAVVRFQAARSPESAPVRSAAGLGCRYSGPVFQPGLGYSSVWPPLCFALLVDIRREQLIPCSKPAYPPELLTGVRARTLYGPAQGERRRIRIRIKQRASTGRKGKMLDDC